MSEFTNTDDFFNDMVDDKPELPAGDVTIETGSTESGDSGSKRPRAKSRTPEEAKGDMDFIIANIQNMDYNEMAEARGISKNQVNRYVQDVRTQLRDRAKELAKKAGTEAYGTKTLESKKEPGKTKIVIDYNNPLTSEAKKVEEKIKEKLSRPKREGMGATKQTVMNQVDSLLGELGI